MPDIAMCRDENCPSRKRCYRFTATPSRMQSYGGFGRPVGDDKCDSYWPTEGRKVRTSNWRDVVKPR